MPRTQSTTPPLDPFPPLSRNSTSQTASTSSQTYAAIAARVHREEERQRQLARNRAVLRSDAPATLPPLPPFWSVDDIDRQDNLDELNFYPAATAGGVEPSPPWRRRRLDNSSTLRTFDTADPTPIPRAAFTGETDDDFVVADDGEDAAAILDGSSNALDPVFSIDNLIGEVETRRPQTARRSIGGPSSRRINPFNLADTGVPLWTTTSAPEGVSAARSTWDGGISAARRNGYGADMSEEPSLYIPPPTDTINPSQTLRRRRRILRRLADGEELNGEIHAWNSMIDMPADEDGWSRNTLYMQPNLTGEDVRLWHGSGLHRGGNNRRRASLRERIASGDSPVRLGSRSLGDLRESSGMAPTNASSAHGTAPLVVRSRTRKVRAEESKPSEEECGQPTKRRRLNPDAPEFRPRSPPLTRPTYLSYSTLNPSTLLPDAFDPPHRLSHLALTTLHRSNRPPRPVVTFTLHPIPTNSDADASALRANRPIPIACGIHYYEAEVLDQGEAGYMSVGWMMRGVDLGRLVGWDTGSWGWHADDGRSFEGQGKGESFAEKWGTGDIVGCGVDFTTGKAFFTKNGRMMGHRFSKLGRGLFPAVGLRTPRESLAINFTGPFLFDIDKYVRDKRDSVWTSATLYPTIQVPQLANQTAPPTPNTDLEAPLPALRDAESRTVAAWVLDYLQHHGYASSSLLLAKGLSRRGLMPAAPEASGSIRRNVPPEDLRLDDFEDRQTAIRHLEHIASQAQAIPAGLLADLDSSGLATTDEAKALRNRMLVSSFVRRLGSLSEELPKEEEDQEEADKALEVVLAFGQSLRSSAKAEKWDSTTQRLLGEAFGLLGTISSEWSDGTKARWAERAKENGQELGKHLRRVNELKPVSHLEKSLAQTRIVTKALIDKGIAEAAFIDVKRIWEDQSSLASSREPRGSKAKHRRGSEGEVEEVVEVKEEKAEVRV